MRSREPVRDGRRGLRPERDVRADRRGRRELRLQRGLFGDRNDVHGDQHRRRGRASGGRGGRRRLIARLSSQSGEWGVLVKAAKKVFREK